MSGIAQHMTRAELTRNTLDCDGQTLDGIAEALCATAGAVAELARKHPHIDLLHVVENCLWQLNERLQDPLDSVKQLAARYSNERTIEEVYRAVSAKQNVHR